MSSRLLHPLVALGLGLALGAGALLIVPAPWLFREPPTKHGAVTGDGRKYACPMFCTMLDAPGECPVCGMDMEPIVDEGNQIRLGRRERFMAGVRTAIVKRKPGVYRLRALGHLRHDERRVGHITAWVSGRLDRLFVDFTGLEVAQGDKVAEIYAPELVSAQEELLSAMRTANRTHEEAGELARNAQVLYASSRRRLALLGLPESLVDEIERVGRVRDRVEIQANVGGTVLTKKVSTGDYVKTGGSLFTVVDLDIVWAVLEVFEEQAGAVFVGQEVEVQVPSLPGELFRGVVSFVDPMLDRRRRVVRVRVDLPNKERRLKPGTFVDAHILVVLTAGGKVLNPKNGSTPGRVLTIPRSAILDGGDRKLVYVMTQEPGPLKDGEDRWPAIYKPREVSTGFRMGDDVVVLAGVEEDEAVVTRGQFLLDSQLQLTGKPSLMVPEAAAAPMDPHAGHGR